MVEPIDLHERHEVDGGERAPQLKPSGDLGLEEADAGLIEALGVGDLERHALLCIKRPIAFDVAMASKAFGHSSRT